MLCACFVMVGDSGVQNSCQLSDEQNSEREPGGVFQRVGHTDQRPLSLSEGRQRCLPGQIEQTRLSFSTSPRGTSRRYLHQPTVCPSSSSGSLPSRKVQMSDVATPLVVGLLLSAFCILRPSSSPGSGLFPPGLFPRKLIS